MLTHVSLEYPQNCLNKKVGLVVNSFSFLLSFKFLFRPLLRGEELYAQMDVFSDNFCRSIYSA